VNRTLAGQIYELAWPVLIAQLAVMAYAVIDSAMAGRYATDDLAAVGIGASIYFSVFVALMGVLLAVTPTVAQLLGAGRHAEIGEQIRQAMWLVLVLAVLSVVPVSSSRRRTHLRGPRPCARLFSVSNGLLPEAEASNRPTMVKQSK